MQKTFCLLTIRSCGNDDVFLLTLKTKRKKRKRKIKVNIDEEEEEKKRDEINVEPV